MQSDPIAEAMLSGDVLRAELLCREQLRTLESEYGYDRIEHATTLLRLIQVLETRHQCAEAQRYRKRLSLIMEKYYV